MYLSPKRLRSGSNVAIIAPASTFSTEDLGAGLDVIREMGLNPILGPCVKNLKTSIFHAASVQDRVNELHWAFSSKHISAIFCVRGGVGSAALLPFLDFDLIKKSQKPFVGKSDITSLSMAMLEHSKLITINGRAASCRTDKGMSTMNSDYESIRHTLRLLMTDQPWGNKPFKINNHFPRTVSPGVAKGYAIGGNCDTFVHLLGTNYFPTTLPAILFLEDTNVSAVELSRMLIHLRLAGVFDRVEGIVIGELANPPHKNGTGDDRATIEEVIMENFGLGKPCAMGFSFSHGLYTSPIPMGAKCVFDATNGTVNFDFQMSSGIST